MTTRPYFKTSRCVLTALMLGSIAPASSRLMIGAQVAIQQGKQPPMLGDSTRRRGTTPPVNERGPGSADTTSRAPNDVVTMAVREFKNTGVAPTITSGNFISFPFGHSQPIVTCARLRACIIELQAGEIVLSRIAGDLERWEIAPASAGPDGRTTLVVVKPKDCDITTNLVLATDRRIYDFTLDSPPCRPTPGRSATNPQDPYARHVRFYYPDETIEQWVKPVAPRVGSDVLQLNFGYEIKRDKQFPWQPAQVFDDGVHVYIKLPESARNGEAPALFILESSGAKTLLNYSVLGDTYVTDRLFDRALLIAGVDGKERKLEMARRAGK